MAFVRNAAAEVLSKPINARWIASALASTRLLDVSTAGADSEAKSWPSWRSPSPSTPRRWENGAAMAVAYQEQRKEHYGTVSVLSCKEEKIQVPVAGSRSTDTDRQEFGYDSIDCMAMYFRNIIMQNVRTLTAKASERRANFIFLVIVESRETILSRHGAIESSIG
jgi:hypothetical protein